MSYRIEKWDEGQKNKYVVFLSHSSADKDWYKVRDFLIENGIGCECDSDINAGSRDFAEVIHSMIIKREIFLLYVTNEQSLTPWVLYELGIACGLGKKIILCTNTTIETEGNYYFRKFGPVIFQSDKLIDEIKNGFFFSDLLTQESYLLNKENYLKECIGNIEICELTIEIPKINKIRQENFRFGYILLGIGLYYGKGKNQFGALRCQKNGVKLKDNNQCIVKNRTCTFCNGEVNSTDVVLNKLLYNCVLVNSELHVKIPFNKYSGVTFKMFVDVLNLDYVKDIMNALADAGMYDISISHSSVGNRVYFMLKKSPLDGVFAVTAPDGFINNYICMGALI